jgi:hypothetical protein
MRLAVGARAVPGSPDRNDERKTKTMSEKATVAAIIDAATAEGTWVNDPIEAVVRNARSGQGNKPSKADLHEVGAAGTKIIASWFSGDLLQFEGGIIRISGKGTKAKIYKGTCELEIGKNATVEQIGAAPAAAAQPAGAPRAAPPAQTEHRFHNEMKRITLLWIHAWQYAKNAEQKLGLADGLPPEIFQACLSSIFITAKDRGLLERPPATRLVDNQGFPFPYVPAEAAHDPEAEKKELEAARLAAEEAARKVAAEAKRREADDSVPF